MMGTIAAAAPRSGAAALAAYEPLAPFYDAFTADYDHETWLAELEGLALACGLRGRRLLDVACGTGKSFLPMLARGYEVSACDISPGMVAEARRKLRGGLATLFVADVRRLPACGPFDLVTCLDDALNYLLRPSDLLDALCSMRSVLRPGGVAVFDLNSLRTYRTAFAGEHACEAGGTRFRWLGEADGETEPGEICAGTLVVTEPSGHTTRTRHMQRHHPRDEVLAACAEAGLRCVATRGQLPGGRLTGEPDESLHHKVVYAAVRSD